jgi:hypothetical protein
MSFWNLFVPKPSLIAKGQELFLIEEPKAGEFIPTSFRDYYAKMMKEEKPSQYLAISCSINGRIIPLVDCDSKDECDYARIYLKRRKIRHAVFQSSPNHYWIFLDKTFNDCISAWNAVRFVPGCDSKYLKYTKKYDVFVVRGELKQSGKTPSLTSIDCVDPNVIKFVENIIEHFGNKQLEDIIKIKEDKECNAPTNYWEVNKTNSKEKWVEVSYDDF